MKIFYKVFLIFILTLISSQSFAQGSDPIKIDPRMAKFDFVPGVALVRLKDDVTTVMGKTSAGAATMGVASVDAILQKYQVISSNKLFPDAKRLTSIQMLKTYSGKTFERPSLHNIYKLTLKDSTKTLDLINELKNNPNVIYAEPDYIYSVVDDKPESPVMTEKEAEKWVARSKETGDRSQKSGDRSQNISQQPNSIQTVTPNDPLYSQQWGIPATQVNAVWDSTTGDTSQIIAILDTGVDWKHPDLKDNIWLNPNPRTTPDADGVVNDIRGWDYINHDNDPMDDNSHGTHVAGIAAAEGNNGIGIAGVDWHAKIMPIKVFQSDGRGDAATITKGIIYAATHGATVINMSWGSYARSLTMEVALENAYATCVLAAAAGNDGGSIYPPPGPFFPAALSYVLGVQATSQIGGLASFSNFDPDGPVYSQYPDLWNYEMRAPGNEIISTIPNGNYRVYSGTSMATPLVSGCVALYQQLYPGQSQELMWGNLINTTGNNLQIFNALNVKAKPQLWFVSNTIVDTLAGDNNNGLVDAGETIQLWFMVRNTWGQSDSVFVGLKFGEFEDTTTAQILKDTAFIGSISPYATRSDERNPLEIHISPNVAHDRDIVFEAYLWYAGSPDTVKQQIVLTANHGTYLAGIMDSNQVLTPDRLWLVNNSFRVGYNGHLVILPGTHLIIYPGKPITIKGDIQAIGTPDSLIRISGYGFSSDGILWQDGNSGRSNIFKYCLFENISQPISGYDFDAYNCTFNNVDYMYIMRNFYNNVFFYSGNWYGDGIFYTPIGNFKFNNFINKSDSRNIFGSLNSAPQIMYNNFINFNAGELQGDSIAPSGQFNAFINPNNITIQASPWGGKDFQYFRNQYFGTIDPKKISKMVYDFLYQSNLPQIIYTPYLLSPPDSCHGIVWKVLVDGIDPQDQANLMNPIGVGPHRFDVYFNRPMDTTYKPQLTFGVRAPFNQQAVADSGHWSDSARIWTAYKTVKLYTGDGINTIRVASAQDPEGFQIPVEDMRFSFLISAASSSSVDFTATAGLGKVNLEWTNPQQVPDLLGYNIYRFQNVTDTTFTTPVMVNSKLVTDTVYTDFNVTPNVKYYYYYKTVNTDFSQSDSSRIVSITPYTAALGDANGDLSVNVLDITSIVAYLLNQNPQPFIFAAADYNSDGVVNVLDIVGIINKIMGVGSTPKIAQSSDKPTLTFDTKAAYLENGDNVSGMQFKIAGKDLSGSHLEIGNAANNMELSYNVVGDTMYVLIYNFKNQTLSQEKGLLFKLDKGQFTKLVKVTASDTRGQQAEIKFVGDDFIVPKDYTLYQNYPNPFNPTTTIRYAIPKQDNVDITIYNILGQRIWEYRAMNQQAGYYEVVWNGRNNNNMMVSTGVYIYQIRSGNFVNQKKMILLK